MSKDVWTKEEFGPFGRVFRQFEGKTNDAIACLTHEQGGEAISALSHPVIGQIDLIWGEPGTQKSDGYGLSKIIKYHPEVIDDLQGIINDMKVIEPSSDNRINLESDCYKASVRLTWDNVPKKWLLTAYKKKNSVPDNTTDTGETLVGERNGTATPQNTVSEFKGINKY